MKSNCILFANPNKTFISKKVDSKHLNENSSFNKKGRSLIYSIKMKNDNVKKYSKKIFIIKKMKRNRKKVIKNKNKSQNDNIPDSSSCLINYQTNPSSLNSIDSLEIQENIHNKDNKSDFPPNTFINNTKSYYDTTCLTDTSRQNIDNIFSFKEKYKDIIMIKIIL
jgi:hypothetical protein